MEMVSCKLDNFDCLSHSPNLGSGSLEWLSPTLTWSIEFDMPHGEVATMPVSNISAASILLYIIYIYYIYIYYYIYILYILLYIYIRICIALQHCVFVCFGT